jgi:hypothetical protein
VGGLLAVSVGVSSITVLAIVAMLLVYEGAKPETIVPLASSAFGVISALVGAYLGIKIGTDQSKNLVEKLGQGNQEGEQLGQGNQDSKQK